MSPFNPDKFRLDSTSAGGVNSSIDRKIEKLSKKCAELIQKNKQKDATKILSEIKKLKALRLPDDDFASSANSTNELEKTLVTTPLTLDQESTLVSPAPEIQKIPADLDKTVVTMPFSPDNKVQATSLQQTEPESSSEVTSSSSKNPGTIFGIGICVVTFFVMAIFSFLAFKDFPGKGNYFDWLKAESIYQKAEVDRKEGKFDEAVINYLEANKIYPDLAKAANARGQIQLLKDNEKDALLDLKDAAMLNQKNSKYQRDYVNALRLNNEEVKAIELVTTLNTKEPEDLQNKALLALLQLQLKQPEADTTFSQAITNTKDSNCERDYYAGLFNRIKGDYNASIQCFKRANKAEPMNVLVLSELIKAKELHHEEAIQETNELTKLAPKWIGAWLLDAKQNEAQRNFSEAAESYAKAAELDNKNSEYYSLAAKAYLEAGKNEDAIKFAKDGLRLNSTDFVCLEVVSKADDKADPIKMEELYKSALDNNQDNAAGWSGLAFWQSKQEGKVLEALQSQATAVKLDKKNAAEWYQLALYLDSFNNTKEALRAAAEAMSLEPENEKYTSLRMKLLSKN